MIIKIIKKERIYIYNMIAINIYIKKLIINKCYYEFLNIYFIYVFNYYFINNTILNYNII